MFLGERSKWAHRGGEKFFFFHNPIPPSGSGSKTQANVNPTGGKFVWGGNRAGLRGWGPFPRSLFFLFFFFPLFLFLGVRHWGFG